MILGNRLAEVPGPEDPAAHSLPRGKEPDGDRALRLSQHAFGHRAVRLSFFRSEGS